MSGTTDQVKGRMKEALGVLTNNDGLKAEGKLDQKTGKIKDAVVPGDRPGQGSHESTPSRNKDAADRHL